LRAGAGEPDGGRGPKPGRDAHGEHAEGRGLAEGRREEPRERLLKERLKGLLAS